MGKIKMQAFSYNFCNHFIYKVLQKDTHGVVFLLIKLKS